MSKIIYHSHHIIPKHVLRRLGLPENWMGADNRIDLTTEEHTIAHRMLWKRHWRWQDKLAVKGISGRIGREEIIREAISAARLGRTPWMKGRKHTPESIEKMSVAKLGKKKSPETREKIGVAMKGQVPWNKGKPHTPEHRRNRSAAVKLWWAKRKALDGNK